MGVNLPCFDITVFSVTPKSGFFLLKRKKNKSYRNFKELSRFEYIIWNNHLNPQAPVAPKISDEVVFRRFQGEGSRSCFESDCSIANSNEWDWREKNDVNSH